MFTAQCRGEAFAIIGIHAFIPKLANASPLLFQKTKLLQEFQFIFVNLMNKHTPCPSQEGNLRSPLLGGDLGVGKKVVGFLSFKTQPNLISF